MIIHSIIGTFETRRFPEQRQEILEYLIQFNRTQKPDIIFTHTKADIHQDHATGTDGGTASISAVHLSLALT